MVFVDIAAITALEAATPKRYHQVMIVKPISDDSAAAADVPLADLRPRLIATMLPHVPFDGWTATARDTAADDTGIDRDIAAMALPDTAAMIDAFTAHADVMMTKALTTAGIADMKIRDRIRLALRTRLEQAGDNREAIRRTLAELALPPNAALGLRLLWRTADAMWRPAGDTATDFNHYSKRAILAGVYSASLLYWLDDDSEDHAATWAFIDRRIDGVMRFEKSKARLKQAVAWLPDPARFLGRLRYPAV